MLAGWTVVRGSLGVVAVIPHRKIGVGVGVARPIRRWNPRTLMSDEVVGTVSPALRRTVSELGPEAERWLGRVPALVAEIAATWKLEVDPVLVHGGCASVILPVTTDRDVPAVLKLSVPHDESKPGRRATALERRRCRVGAAVVVGRLHHAVGTVRARARPVGSRHS